MSDRTQRKKKRHGLDETIGGGENTETEHPLLLTASKEEGGIINQTGGLGPHYNWGKEGNVVTRKKRQSRKISRLREGKKSRWHINKKLTATLEGKFSLSPNSWTSPPCPYTNQGKQQHEKNKRASDSTQQPTEKRRLSSVESNRVSTFNEQLEARQNKKRQPDKGKSWNVKREKEIKNQAIPHDSEEEKKTREKLTNVKDRPKRKKRKRLSEEKEKQRVQWASG